MKILLAEMENICKPCAERMKTKNLIAVRIEEGQIDKLLAWGDIGKVEAGRLRTAINKGMVKEGVKYFEDLPEEIQDAIFEGLKKDLINDGAMANEGVDITNEDAVNEYVGEYINRNNDPGSNMQWLEAYWWNSETRTKLPEYWKDEDWYKGKMAMKQVVAVSGFRGKSMFGVKEIKGEICPDCKKDMIEKGKCGKCGYKTAQKEEAEEDVLSDEDIDNMIEQLENQKKIKGLDPEEEAILKQYRGLLKEKQRYEKHQEDPGEPAYPSKSVLPKRYDKPKEEVKDLSEDVDLLALFGQADKLTAEVERINALVETMTEKVRQEEGYEDSAEKLEGVWKDIRKKIGDQPNRIAQIKDRVYYIMNQIRRSFHPPYKEIGEQIIREFEIEFKDIGKRMQKRFEKLVETKPKFKEIFKLYTSPIETYKKHKGQVVDLPAAPDERGEVTTRREVAPQPEVAPRPATPALEVAEAPAEAEDNGMQTQIDLIDEMVGYSYDVLDVLMGLDDDLTILDFTVSDMEDQIESNGGANGGSRNNEQNIVEQATEEI